MLGVGEGTAYFLTLLSWLNKRQGRAGRSEAGGAMQKRKTGSENQGVVERSKEEGKVARMGKVRDTYIKVRQGRDI